MTVEIEIIDRVYHNIEDFCNVNGLNIKEYMSDAITEKYNLDRYGDLNEKLTKKEEKKPSTRSTKKEEKIDNPKPSETEETKSNITDELIPVKPMKEPSGLSRVVKMDVIEDVKDTTEEKSKRTRRTLKTK